MPKEVVDNVNDYVEKIAKDKKKSKKLDMGDKLVGQVKQEIALEKEFYESHFKNFLTYAVQSYVYLVTKQKTKNFVWRTEVGHAISWVKKVLNFCNLFY